VSLLFICGDWFAPSTDPSRFTPVQEKTLLQCFSETGEAIQDFHIGFEFDKHSREVKALRGFERGSAGAIYSCPGI
jgi:hypothetical protein